MSRKADKMKPENSDITVTRVENGWIVSAGHDYANDRHGARCVARTPGELAQILTDWAAAQERK
jgi:hypothetical protein